MGVCNLRYSAHNAHAPYCHLWPVRLYNIFPCYLINGTIFEKKKVIGHKLCFFSTTFVWNISHFNKNWPRSDKKYVFVFMYSTRYSCKILIKPKLYRQAFEKYQISNFTKLLPVGAKLFHADRWTDGGMAGHTDMTRLIVAFRNFANASKMTKVFRWLYRFAVGGGAIGWRFIALESTRPLIEMSTNDIFCGVKATGA